jgi:S1-C subfamily serine protease
MMELSENMVYDTRTKNANRSGLWIIVIIMMVLNIGVLTYVTFYNPVNNINEATNEQLQSIETEIESLRFQLSNLNLEINSLREEIRIIDNNGGIEPPSIPVTLTELYNQTRKSVVLIQVQTLLGGGQGSGFVYNKEGYIITNNHVVEDAQLVEVTFLDGSIETAEIIGTDPYSDMAVIKVEVPSSMLNPVKMGVSSKMLVGEQVFALGNPFGLANTVTTGIISAIGRRMDAPGGFTIVDVVQTDAAINPGNSGGPLLNLHGEVVGMNTAILSETRQFSGIGFAIPSDTITREVNSLIENGVYEHPWIGISGYEVSPAIAEAMGLNEDTRGTLIATISEGGPAEDAGLIGSTKTETIGGVPFQIGGDIIIGADGVPMNTFYELIVYISREKQPGNSITFTIIRDGELLEQDLILGTRPPP